MIVDEARIQVKAGDGGKGGVYFNRNQMELGPAGGNGGRGGTIFFQGVSDLGALGPYPRKKEFHAQDGENGKAQFVDGKDGENMVLTVPVGTIIKNTTTGETREIIKIGEEFCIAKGGNGGKGNFKFRSPTNTSPQEFGPGTSGEAFDLDLALKFIADVGFVGLPNVGKSTLLNLLTNAKSKVANYHFTTLEPHLGVYYDLILADIPGLIEGASGGRGLGHKFLRHVERTNTLFHFLSAESSDIVHDYETIRGELETFNPALVEKEEVVVISKIDMVDTERLEELRKKASTITDTVYAISMYDDESLEPIKERLRTIMDEKKSTDL